MYGYVWATGGACARRCQTRGLGTRPGASVIDPHMAALRQQQRPFSYADAETAHRQSQLLAMNNLRGCAPQDVNNNNNLNPLMERSFTWWATRRTPCTRRRRRGDASDVAGGSDGADEQRDLSGRLADARRRHANAAAQVGLPTYPAPHEGLYASTGARRDGTTHVHSRTVPEWVSTCCFKILQSMVLALKILNFRSLELSLLSVKLNNFSFLY